MNEPPTFDEAVGIALETLSKGKEDCAFDSAVSRKVSVNISAAEIFGVIKVTGAGGVEVKDNRDFLKLAEQQDDIELKVSFESGSSDLTIPIEQMINKAEKNAASFDTSTEIAAIYAEKGKSMPEALGQWAASVLRGEKKRPVRHGKFANGTGLRNTCIWMVTRKLVQRGMTATRNDTSPP
jgi:hypothetical protein